MPATLERLRQQTHRELDFNHLKVVVLGEAVARESTPTLDELERNMQIPRNVFMAVAHGQARPLLSASARGEDIPAIYLRHAYAGKYARTRAILAIPAWHLLTFTAREPLRDTMAGGLCIDKEGILNFCGAAVWKGKRMIGWLDATETGALNMMSRIRKSDGDIVAPGNPAPAVHVTNHTSRYWIERETTGALVLHLSLLTQGDLVNSDRPIVSTQDLSRAEARLAETQRRQVERMIRHLQRLGSDPLGFGERLRRREPDAPEVQGTEAWHAAYVRARVQVDSGVLIYNRGFIR